MEELSVFQLLTKLCESISHDAENLNKLRTIAYEVLLKKRVANLASDVNAPDIMCKLMLWQFTLMAQHGCMEQTDLQTYGECVKNFYNEDIIHLLFLLRNIPSTTHNDVFELPIKFDTVSESQAPVKERFSKDLLDTLAVWKKVDTNDNFRRVNNWENFGRIDPRKEKVFVSELGESSDLWVEYLSSEHISSISNVGSPVKPFLRSIEEFLEDVKCLLVGMASTSFGYNKSGSFYLLPSIRVEGLTFASIQMYSEDFILCGACYKALNDISTPNSYSGKYKENGYLFAELCQSIQRYLGFYRSAVISLRSTNGLLKMHQETSQLRKQLTTIAAVCKLGPYVMCEKMPHGVLLLNYLYQTILKVTDRKLLLVLYAILFPCCQVYFNRFLQQWLLQGIVNDPYEEFFIKPNIKYISTRGRTYWTRSYSIRDDIVPDFLSDLKSDILVCGKAMNLLKLCTPRNATFLFLTDQKPLIFCCSTLEQLNVLDQKAILYYQEALSLCGGRIDLQECLRSNKMQNQMFLNLIESKRRFTLRRIELEWEKVTQQKREEKYIEINILKEQLDSTIEQKQVRAIFEIENELQDIRANMETNVLQNKLIEKESEEIINYYRQLMDVTDKRQKEMELHIERMKSCLDMEGKVDIASSDDSFYSLDEGKHSNELVMDYSSSSATNILSNNLEKEFKSLDEINANRFEETIPISLNSDGTTEENVLSNEMTLTASLENDIRISNTVQLSDAQRNKLKILGSDFGTEMKLPNKKLTKEWEVNRNACLRSHDCFYPELDNGNYINRNKSHSTVINEKLMTKSISLPLDLPLETPLPMSVDTTPDSAPSTTAITLNYFDHEKLPQVSDIHTTDNQEDFEELPYYMCKTTKPSDSSFQSQKRREMLEFNSSSLRMLLHESISIPLSVQRKLAENQLLKYIIHDLEYFKHLSNLRDYFFLQDGEFGRNITENLFEKLYDVHFPIELINCRTLQSLVYDALQMSSKFQENSTSLSFKINRLPKRFHLSDPDVLDCLSFAYRVKWPLNILLPADTIGKYDEVFKYLLKLTRVAWVLKKIFLELKVLSKLSGKKEIYLMSSPQYRKLHQYRHIMLHFVQTLQNYIVGDVLQPSWEMFTQTVASIDNLDSLYNAHTSYIKNILFLCLLNQKSTPLRKIVQKIFVIILKFYDYLRSCSWTCENGIYIHPNFEKLEHIFFNFKDFVLYLFKIGTKVSKSGYQSHLSQLLDILDINGYYSNKINVD